MRGPEFDGESRVRVAVMIDGKLHEHHSIVGNVKIGRNDDCQIILDDPGVSRLHAEIYFLDGKPWVRDMGSANGTLLNGKTLEQGIAAGDGDCLRIDRYDIYLSFPGASTGQPHGRDVTARARRNQ